MPMYDEDEVEQPRSKFCRVCGEKLEMKYISAEKYTESYDGFDIYSVHPKFDPDTGKQQYVAEYSCPNQTMVLGFINLGGHDSFVEGGRVYTDIK